MQVDKYFKYYKFVFSCNKKCLVHARKMQEAETTETGLACKGGRVCVTVCLLTYVWVIMHLHAHIL